MNSKQTLVKQLIAEIQEIVPATYSIDLAFRLCSCRLYSNSPALLRKLQGCYQRVVAQVPTPDFLVTILDTPPILLNSAYDLYMSDEGDFRVASDVADELDGMLSHDRICGMLTVTDRGRYILLGPAMEHTELVQLYLYNLYQGWRLQRHQTGAIGRMAGQP